MVREIVSYDHRINGAVAQQKAIVRLVDGSNLLINEVWIEGEMRKYAYYQVTPTGDVVQGWDNAPHHPGVSTYPHHHHSVSVGLKHLPCAHWPTSWSFSPHNFFEPMRLIYLVLSPTFGMHQYTADLANRLAAEPGLEVHLVTTATLPRDRYNPAVRIHTPVATRTTGFAPEGLDLPALRRVLKTVDQIAEGRESEVRGSEGQRSEGRRVRDQRISRPQDPNSSSPPPFPPFPPPVIHFPAVHLWNVLLVPALRRRGYRVIHTLHDLDPHSGVRFAGLIRLWNRLIVRSVDHVLVHGQVYRQRLLQQGVAPSRVTAVPLLHLFLSHAAGDAADALGPDDVAYEPWALFFGRLERYKGVGTLLEAAALASRAGQPLRLLLAGSGDLAPLWNRPLPPGVELRSRRIADAEAVDLFRRCGLLVLPYLDATQSALVAAAYAFRKPVLVTRAGALPEYVQEGVTGWIVPPGDAAALSQALAAALANPGRLAVMGAAGRHWYEAQRSLEYQALLDLYRG